MLAYDVAPERIAVLATRVDLTITVRNETGEANCSSIDFALPPELVGEMWSSDPTRSSTTSSGLQW